MNPIISVEGDDSEVTGDDASSPRRFTPLRRVSSDMGTRQASEPRLSVCHLTSELSSSARSKSTDTLVAGNSRGSVRGKLHPSRICNQLKRFAMRRRKRHEEEESSGANNSGVKSDKYCNTRIIQSSKCTPNGGIPEGINNAQVLERMKSVNVIVDEGQLIRDLEKASDDSLSTSNRKNSDDSGFRQDSTTESEANSLPSSTESLNRSSNQEAKPLRQDSVESTGSSASDQNSSSSSHSWSEPKVPCHVSKFKLIHEGDINVTRLYHSDVFNKILNNKFLRRPQMHHLLLTNSEIVSKGPSGYLDRPIQYSQIEQMFLPSDQSQDAYQNCVRLMLPEGSILLQASNAYSRDQWYYSISWKRSMYKYANLIKTTSRPEVLLKQIKCMGDAAMKAPVQDEAVHQDPVNIISKFLSSEKASLCNGLADSLLMTLVPLLEHCQPTEALCHFLADYCAQFPRSVLITQELTQVTAHIIKRNTDFGKYPNMRKFLHHYIKALYCHNNGHDEVVSFVRRAHGSGLTCPHPRILPNLVSVCLGAVYSVFEDKQKLLSPEMVNDNTAPSDDSDQRLHCFVKVLIALSEYDDWRPQLALMIQSAPFPDMAIASDSFIIMIAPVIESFVKDRRCEVHRLILGDEDSREGWFDLFSPKAASCQETEVMWVKMLDSLYHCCYRRKGFVQKLVKMVASLQLLALRDTLVAQEILCSMIEWDLLEQQDTTLQVLRSTQQGRTKYAELCERQAHLQTLQQKGGPKKLTLPPHSTNQDLIKMLSCGSFGSLECLSLAFTNVSSECAHQLIKLPSLRYLNLWSTQFGDSGLMMISEHLPKLQVLNLCETPVTDEGLVCLSAMKSLRKLNLNSTRLSPWTFEGLKEKLPALEEVDIRYTDAW